MASAAEATARHRKRKRKSHCSSERRCGKKCCPKGKICAGDVCEIGQGVCPTGVDSCTGATYICGGVGVTPCGRLATTEGDTRCIQLTETAGCGACTTSDDCASFGPGAVCVGLGANCCDTDQGQCDAPRLVGAASVKQAPAGTAALLPH